MTSLADKFGKRSAVMAKTILRLLSQGSNPRHFMDTEDFNLGFSVLDRFEAGGHTDADFVGLGGVVDAAEDSFYRKRFYAVFGAALRRKPAMARELRELSELTGIPQTRTREQMYESRKERIVAFLDNKTTSWDELADEVHVYLSDAQVSHAATEARDPVRYPLPKRRIDSISRVCRQCDEEPCACTWDCSKL